MDTSNNMDELQNHANWKKPDQKRLIHSEITENAKL